MSKTYEIRFPVGYKAPSLPGRDLWVAALRSGNFTQGSAFLSWANRDCCLGVLCKIQKRPQRPSNSVENKLAFDGQVDLLHESNPVFSFIGENGRFPQGVDIFMPDPDPDPDHTQDGNTSVCLAGCNDRGLTFDQIADIIERVWAAAPPNWEAT